VIPMSAAEIKEYWHDYCQRKSVSEAARRQGDQWIDEDPEYWADHTMPELLEAITAKRRP